MNQPLRPVISDRLDRTAFHCFLAKRFLLRGLGLLVNVRMPAVVVAGVVRRSRLPAKVAIDALIIDVKAAGDVLRIFVCYLSHDRKLSDGQIMTALSVCN